MIPYTKTQKFFDSKPDIDLLNKIIRDNQKEYIRRKLRFFSKLIETQDFNQTVLEYGVDYTTAHNYLNLYLKEGFEGVAKIRTRGGQSKLSLENKQKLVDIIINQSPVDYGIDRYIWTGEIICKVVKLIFDIELKDSRIYEILNELGLSHQKAHRDYDNADKEKQKEFQSNLKKNSNSSKIWKTKDKK
jgi:transposase